MEDRTIHHAKAQRTASQNFASLRLGVRNFRIFRVEKAVMEARGDMPGMQKSSRSSKSLWRQMSLSKHGHASVDHGTRPAECRI
jgi:hypothetical protein